MSNITSEYLEKKGFKKAANSPLGMKDYELNEDNAYAGVRINEKVNLSESLLVARRDENGNVMKKVIVMGFFLEESDLENALSICQLRIK